MKRYVAFLRGMNVGGRRITNEELCGHVRGLGFEEVSAVLASGNVLLAATDGTAAQVARRLQDGLGEALGYDVLTFVRTAEEVVAIAAHQPFEDRGEADGGKLQVALLARKPTAAARLSALTHATDDDRLQVHGRELYWLPRGKITESRLDYKALESALGAMTVRTRRTLERLAARCGEA
jgi:uncharacterized protein (DUF1697 family)